MLKTRFVVWRKWSKKPLATFDTRDDAKSYIQVLSASGTALAIFEFSGATPFPELIGTWAYSPNENIPNFVSKSHSRHLN
jgi:hypothetical protein